MTKPNAKPEAAKTQSAEVLQMSGVAVVEATPPTFEQSIEKLNEQLVDPNLFPLVKDALLKVRGQIVQQRIKTLNDEVKALRATLPKRMKHVKK